VQVRGDRKQSICQGVKKAKEQTIVLIAGKGHENYQLVGDVKHAFSDVLVASQCLGVAE